ncbi:unnamed protein product, partial [marine sediment metagenome]
PSIPAVSISNIKISTTERSTAITANMYSEGRETPVRIEKTERAVTMESMGVRAETQDILELDSSGLFIKRNETRKRLDILPHHVNKTVKGVIDSVDRMEIKLEDKPVYHVKGRKTGNLLWFIPVILDIDVEVNANTGSIENIARPWWSFLVF